MSINSKMTALANSIRSKSNVTGALGLDAMKSAVDGIELGITPSGLISITQNGTYDVTSKASATVNVNGGNGIFHESGTVAMHTGSAATKLNIPVSDDSFDHYFGVVRGSKSWLLVDGIWAEQSSLDFTGVSATQYAVLIEEFFYPQIISNPITNGSGETKTNTTKFGGAHSAISIISGTQFFPSTDSINLSDGEFEITVNHNFCNSTWGMTYEYEIWGWNNA